MGWGPGWQIYLGLADFALLRDAVLGLFAAPACAPPPPAHAGSNATAGGGGGGGDGAAGGSGAPPATR